ncbi:MAG: molybdopterin-synthase adenylyltransferase MoeB [Cytophagia bacterium]|nr:MAG: molybdopterin-synthase adenylyltransferase MoeB [Cytophagales bacterium]TAG40415.1 MAG: molybdopterin-synthase adenylyltransferase MoeB [Cytophagia bacterium]TAG81984.1 MAG: molybdopterin-synthase adenylyltransferase MoeB [Cytophagales bacterium]
MLSAAELQRYSRHLLIPEFGVAGQERLKAAKVLVIGCGGLGSPVLLYLAAAGVGTIGLIDNDTVDMSNLQRQILYGTESVGKPKVTEAAQRLRSLNPHVKIEPHHLYLTSQNALALFAPYDLIIDGSDNFPTRYLVNDACVLLNKPFVYGAIYRFEGQVAIFNYQNGPHYRDLFATPPPLELAPNCAEAGVLGVLPGMVGAIQANEAIKLLAQIGQPLTGRLFVIDALSLTTRIIQIPKLPNRPVISQLIDYEQFCAAPNLLQISPQTFREWQQMDKDFQLIDVREAHEYASEHLGGALMPLSELEKHVADIARHKLVVVYCQSGIRSQKAIELLQNQHGFDNLINLTGGINAVLR